jgi:3'-5' exoribonuclease
MEKQRYIEELEEGEAIDELFMVKASRLGETRAGKPYLSLTLSDKSGEIQGPVWDNAESLQDVCTPGNVVRIQGLVQVYRDKLQLRIERLQQVEVETDQMEAFVQSSHRGMEEMAGELRQVIGSVKNSFLKKLLTRIFIKDETGKKFLESPAAKGIHHAYLGGLLEHSLSMAKVASLLARHYPGIDHDILVSGALLHDIGKTAELTSEGGIIDYTDKGRLKGHLVMGCEFVGQEASKIKDFPDDLLTHLQHMVLSHHGRQEFGSPVVPMTPEALLLGFIDDMDAKMNLVEQLRRKLKNGQNQWSEYQRSLERYLLLSPLSEDVFTPVRTAEDNTLAAGKQPTLF